MKKRAMILAAGRGKRLRPLTDTMPKPLVKVGDLSLIEHHLIHFAESGIDEVVINHAWLGNQIEAVLGNGERYGLHITYSVEPEEGLETAGGIIQALPMLTDGVTCFYVVNGDVFTDFPFEKLQQINLAEGMLAHLVLVPNPDFKSTGDFGVVSLPQGQATLAMDYTFSGISVLHPDLFKGLAQGRLALGSVLKTAIAEGKVTAELYQGYWSDVGTLERLEKTREDFLEKTI